MRFSGYDNTREIPFFVEEDAVRKLEAGLLSSAEALLAAFDRHRDRICKTALHVYGKKREGSYTLKAADF